MPEKVLRGSGGILMSVLKARRHESKAEFVNVADQIYSETMGFLAKLSNRYQRLLAQDTMHLASMVLDHTECAQNIRITDRVTFETREKHLVEARSYVMALDVHLSHIWVLMMENPQGCFTNTKGETRQPADALRLLDNMADSLGEKIDFEKNLITKLLQSDKEKFRKINDN